jgi:SAM-dependent methyltransferase
VARHPCHARPPGRCHDGADHDIKQNIAALLQWIEGKPPFTILDFGCGPGRNLMVFSELGHVAVGLEGAKHFAVMARTYSGCEVWQQDFLKLDLPDNHFDGVYANASLFHVPSQELPRVLLELHASLKPGGVSSVRGVQPCKQQIGRKGVLERLGVLRVVFPAVLEPIRMIAQAKGVTLAQITIA